MSSALSMHSFGGQPGSGQASSKRLQQAGHRSGKRGMGEMGDLGWAPRQSKPQAWVSVWGELVGWIKSSRETPTGGGGQKKRELQSGGIK